MQVVKEGFAFGVGSSIARMAVGSLFGDSAADAMDGALGGGDSGGDAGSGGGEDWGDEEQWTEDEEL